MILNALSFNLNALSQIGDKTEIRNSFFVDDAELIVNEKRAEEDSQGEYFSVVSQVFLSSAQTLGVHKVDIEDFAIFLNGYWLTPEP